MYDKDDEKCTFHFGIYTPTTSISFPFCQRTTHSTPRKPYKSSKMSLSNSRNLLKVFSFFPFILGISPVHLKFYKASRVNKVIRLIWWLYSISVFTYFLIVSFDMLYPFWFEGKGIIYLMATTGVTSMEYFDRNVLRFLCLLKANEIEDFVYNIVVSDFQQRPKCRSSSSQQKMNYIYNSFYCLIIAITLFNIRMEYKANENFFLVYSPTEFSDMSALNSMTNFYFLQKFVSYTHDILQVTVIGFMYLTIVFFVHQFECLILDLTEITLNSLVLLFRTDNLIHSVLSGRVHYYQNTFESVVGPFLLIAFPSSIAIPILQLYKAMAGFDTDLFYSQLESGIDVVVYLVRVLILVNCGHRIHQAVII